MENDSNIIGFTGTTVIDIPPDKILDGAKGRLNEVLVLGWDKEDNLYAASSTSDIPEVIFLIERAKDFLLRD